MDLLLWSEKYRINGVCSLTGKASDCESESCEFESRRAPQI